MGASRSPIHLPLFGLLKCSRFVSSVLNTRAIFEKTSSSRDNTAVSPWDADNISHTDLVAKPFCIQSPFIIIVADAYLEQR